VDRFHVEGMPQDERDVFLSAEIGEPIPDEHAFDGDYEIVPEGFDGSQKGFRRGFEVSVEHCFALLIQDAEVHGSGV
jgi:hypothetical protein